MSLSVQARLDVLQSLEETLSACQFPTNEDLSSGRYVVVFNKVLRQVHEAVCVIARECQERLRAHSLEHEAAGREPDSDLKLADQVGGNGDQKATG